ARVVAAFGDLDVGRRLLRREQARRGVVVEILRQLRLGAIPGIARKAALLLAQIAFGARGLLAGENVEERWRLGLLDMRLRGIEPGGRQNLLQFARADDCVYFGNILLNFVAIALDQTPGHDELACGARGLVLGHFQNRVDGLLFGRVDERA